MLLRNIKGDADVFYVGFVGKRKLVLFKRSVGMSAYYLAVFDFVPVVSVVGLGKGYLCGKICAICLIAKQTENDLVFAVIGLLCKRGIDIR